MKKIFLLFTALLLTTSVFFVGCGDDDNNEQGKSSVEVKLDFPSKDAIIDMGEESYADGITFTWIAQEGVMSYVIEISDREDFANLLVDISGNMVSYLWKFDAIDEECNNLGVGYEETATFYWRVRATNAYDFSEVTIETRAVVVKRQPTPPYEALFNGRLFSAAALPGDNVSVASSNTPAKFWDGNKSTVWTTDYRATEYSFPQYFTINLGVTGKLSRFKLWMRSNYYYDYFAFREFEVWGAESCKQGEDLSYWTGEAWKNDWQKLGDFAINRPSGGDEGDIIMMEDDAAAQAGFENKIPDEKSRLRYLRFVVKRVWGATGVAMQMAEIEIYGDNR